MSDVFISYKTEEFADAIWLKQILEKNGISCWMAPQNIPGGSNYAREIPIAIESCKVFIILLSDKAQESIWVSKEINMALNFKKLIMPFMLENCELHKEFNFYLSDIQRYAAYESKSNAVKEMLTEINKILGGKTNKIHIPADKGNINNRIIQNNDKRKPKHRPGLIALILLTYLICIPGGIITTFSYILGRFGAGNSNKIFKTTKILCMLSIIIGCFFFMIATFNYSRCNEAYYVSIVGIIMELIAEM